VQGGSWLGFPIRRGKCLVIDNELHEEEITTRLTRVAEAICPRLAGEEAAAYHARIDEILADIVVLSLRSTKLSVPEIVATLGHIAPGEFRLGILDSLYRATPKGSDENSNQQRRELIDEIDTLADRLRLAFMAVHHANKGDQAGKDSRDVGSGGSAQTRAVDAHIVLRPHTEPDCAVVHVNNNTFRACPPFCLRWEFPLARLAPELDPGDMASAPTRQQAARQTNDTRDTATIVRRLGEAGPDGMARTAIELETGISRDRLRRLLAAATREGRIGMTGDRYVSSAYVPMESVDDDHPDEPELPADAPVEASSSQLRVQTMPVL